MDLIHDRWQVLFGSCLDRLKELPDNSVDSVITDPPYELGFMGKKWDSSGIAFNPEVWIEVMRVLKPGGHLLAFGGSRTWHRLAAAIEDAGFEIRDSIAWLYGSGFPKSMDISKAIDKAAGVERKVIGTREQTGAKFKAIAEDIDNGGFNDPDRTEFAITAPATAEAQQWAGWGTALKPAFEPIVVGRKPLIGTVAQNVLTYGTGGLNIGGSRIGNEVRKNNINDFSNQHGNSFGNGEPIAKLGESEVTGRWPANIILDEYTAELLDEQSGTSKSGKPREDRGSGGIWGEGDGVPVGQQYGDTGGASRFFYVAKASKKDRNEGLDEVDGREIGAKGNGLSRICSICGTPQLKPCGCEGATFINPVRKNFHPTVKPTELMRYLVKLVTPPGGVVLDPFTGSGSTGKAAILDGYKFIGIELTEEYLPIIQGRIRFAETKSDDLLL